jgi:anthranilate/para-aminobenzoate synthase component II
MSTANKLRLLMIDNYDSFTYNIVQYFGELGADVEVFRNDEITLEEIAARRPDRLVVSPGPCSPNEAGISVPAIRRFWASAWGTRAWVRPWVATSSARSNSCTARPR